uniref:Adenosylhomocysteinase n=1 Tax=Schistosoma mansoni TaxID=6183 RepID=A0A5K4EJB5_SCHMA
MSESKSDKYNIEERGSNNTNPSQSDQLAFTSSQVTLKAFDGSDSGDVSTDDLPKLCTPGSRLVPAGSLTNSDSTSSYKSREKRRSSVLIDKRAYHQNQHPSLSSISSGQDDSSYTGSSSDDDDDESQQRENPKERYLKPGLRAVSFVKIYHPIFLIQLV